MPSLVAARLLTLVTVPFPEVMGAKYGESWQMRLSFVNP